MNGKTVDVEALRLKNEKTIAVGNMRVNARGDEVAPDGTIIKKREQLVNAHYDVHSNVPTEDQIYDSAVSHKKVVADEPVVSKPATSTTNVVDEPIAESSESVTKPRRGGLADAIAKKSNSTEMKEVKTPQRTVKDQGGVKRV